MRFTNTLYLWLLKIHVQRPFRNYPSTSEASLLTDPLLLPGYYPHTLLWTRHRASRIPPIPGSGRCEIQSVNFSKVKSQNVICCNLLRGQRSALHGTPGGILVKLPLGTLRASWWWHSTKIMLWWAISILSPFNTYGPISPTSWFLW